MAKIERFEDLIAWQKARILAHDIYVTTREEQFRRDFGLASQVQRAAVSVMANLAEGFERRRKAEFHRYVEIAKASCAEVSSHLYVALDVGYIEASRFEALQSQVAELGRILAGLKASLDGTRNSELGTRN